LSPYMHLKVFIYALRCYSTWNYFTPSTVRSCPSSWP
jgi:hypothetical protein